VVAEIGFIGYFCGTADGGDVLRKNVTGGYLCRTKRFLENEGGVAAGYAVIDSVCVKK
jgi:glutathione synthase